MSSWWKGYVASNEAFASTVMQSLRVGDMVWVHSHPLLLVPSALRQARIPPSCTVSFFLHTPFPSPEIWRVVPFRKELLHGMLATVRTAINRHVQSAFYVKAACAQTLPHGGTENEACLGTVLFHEGYNLEIGRAHV